MLTLQIVRSHSRVVVTSSGVITMVQADGDITPGKITALNTAGADAEWLHVYASSKFAQLLGAHWWRRQLGKDATVVAVSPGMIKDTGLGRHTGLSIDAMPDAKTPAEGPSSPRYDADGRRCPVALRSLHAR